MFARRRAFLPGGPCGRYLSFLPYLHHHLLFEYVFRWRITFNRLNCRISSINTRTMKWWLYFHIISVLFTSPFRRRLWIQSEEWHSLIKRVWWNNLEPNIFRAYIVEFNNISLCNSLSCWWMMNWPRKSQPASFFLLLLLLLLVNWLSNKDYLETIVYHTIDWRLDWGDRRRNIIRWKATLTDDERIPFAELAQWS